MIQILHISDLHLSTPSLLQAWGGHVFTHLPVVKHYYSVADPKIKSALKRELSRIAGSHATILALTGDIALWPDVLLADIKVFYEYVEKLVGRLPSGSVLLPILGNHDWGPFQHTTKFVAEPPQTPPATDFEDQYNIGRPQVQLFQSGNLRAIFFLVDSNNAMIPATGEISQQTQSFLATCFADGKIGNLGLTSQEYDQAVKILLLHHSPLDDKDYDSALSQEDHRKLKLDDASSFMQLCKDDVDIFLFGHTHVPTKQAAAGFVMVDAGTTLAQSHVLSSPCPTLQAIKIMDRDTVEVDTYCWRRVRFSSHGSKGATFRRNQASGTDVLGRGRWA